MRLSLALAVLAALAVPVRAETWTWDDEASELEVRNFYKSMVTGIRLPESLADPLALPTDGALWTHTTRTWGHLVLRERYELQAGYQLGALIASDPAFESAAAVSDRTPLATAPRARRRLVDLDPILAERGGMTLIQGLDLLALKVDARFAELTVGRQVLSWGAGRLWNPTDLLSPFAPTDIDREVRRGVDAVRVSIPLAATSQLDVLWLPLPDLRDHGAVVRATVNVKGFDIAPSAAKYVRDTVVGLDVTGDIGKLGVHGEAAWTRALDRDDDGHRDQFVRAVVGAEARPKDSLVLGAEYYYNGWGATDPADYLNVLASDRVRRGEVFGAGRHYLGATASWQATELLTVRGVALVDVLDPSIEVLPALEYWAEQKVLVRAGAYLPLGRKPTGTASDLELRSEYGAAPVGAFAQIAIYLL